MTEKGDALLAELVDGLWKGLPAETDGRKVDADFNDDGTATVLVGASEFPAVKRERRRGPGVRDGKGLL